MSNSAKLLILHIAAEFSANPYSSAPQHIPYQATAGYIWSDGTTTELPDPGSIVLKVFDSHQRPADRWADDRQFLPAIAFDRVRSVALPSGEPIRSGWYLLHFHDRTWYLGESVDLRGRMAGHDRTWGKEIETVRLRPQTTSKKVLRRQERIFIRELEDRSVPLRNVVHAGVTAGRDALDELIPATEQDKWLADPIGINTADTTPLKAMPEQEIRYSAQARWFLGRPGAAELTGILRGFLESCVPLPRATEFQYWSVSVRSYSGKRRFCVNVGMMEMLVVGDNLSGFLNVRNSLLAPTGHALRQFRHRHPRVTVRHRPYADSGNDVVTLQCPDVLTLQRLLADPEVTSAAARLVLDVMRKHFCQWTRNHCPQLVQTVYPHHPRTTAPVDAAADIVGPKYDEPAEPIALVAAEPTSSLPPALEGPGEGPL